MGPSQRKILLLGCAILAIIGAWMGYRLIRPELGPERVAHDPLKGPPNGLATEEAPRRLGAAGAAGMGGATFVPPPPAPPTSMGTALPSVGRFRATGIVRSGEGGPGIPHATVELFEGSDAHWQIIGLDETDEAGLFVIDLPALDERSSCAR